MRESLTRSVKEAQRESYSGGNMTTGRQSAPRLSERMTEEILQMTHGDDNIAPEIWQELFRFSALQTDEDLYGMLPNNAPQNIEDDPNFDADIRDSEDGKHSFSFQNPIKAKAATEMTTINNQLHQNGNNLR